MEFIRKILLNNFNMKKIYLTKYLNKIINIYARGDKINAIIIIDNVSLIIYLFCKKYSLLNSKHNI